MRRSALQHFRFHRSSSGVALITILLVVVIATVLGVSMTTDQHFAISRAATFFDHSRVRQYALGGEELARQILHEDFVNDPGVDHLGEAWAAEDLRFEFEEGAIEIKIEDLQGRLNLNTLQNAANGNPVSKTRLQVLFNEQSVDSVFVDRIQDWIDDNSSVTGVGAEDFDYLGLERPYRTGNQMMVDTSELRLILEMEEEIFAQIAPFVATIPDATTSINLNTASPQVLTAVAPGLSVNEAEIIATDRDAGVPFGAIDDFTGLLDNSIKVINDGLDVQSSFFQVSVRAQVQDRIGYLTSVIQRDTADGSMRVIYRDLSKKIQPFIVLGETN